MEKVTHFFNSRLKKGILTSNPDLLSYIAKKKISLTVLEKKSLPKLRRKWKSLAMYTPFKKVPHYAKLGW